MSPSLYESPLIYDIAFGWDPDVEVESLTEAFMRYGRGRGRLLELGCGGGRLLPPLAERGFTVVGLDRCAEMVAFARRRTRDYVGRIEIVEGDMADFDLGQENFDGAFCMVDTFRYLLSEREVESHFRSVAGALKPGGVYVLDFSLVGDPENYPSDIEVWDMEREGIKVRTVVSADVPDLKNHRERMVITCTVNSSDGRYELVEESVVRPYTITDFRGFVGRSGFFEIAEYFGAGFDIDRPQIPDKHSTRITVILKRIG